jgi:hypothetical protein
MATVTIQALPPIDGVVTLSGQVTIEPGDEYRMSHLAVMPYVWQFASPHSGSPDHGWRQAALHRFYGIEDSGRWTAERAYAGLQYAAFLVPGHFLLDEPLDGLPIETIPEPDDGTLPEDGVLSPPAFTHISQAVHIESAPDDHLTGAVLGVGHAGGLRMMAWTKKQDGSTFVIGEVRCERSGYWTFGKIKASLRSGESYSVALVTEAFDASSPIPPRGRDVISISSRPHEPLRTHGSRSTPRRP